MAQLRIDLIDTLNDRRLSVKLPDDVPLEQLVPALARKLGLPEGEYALTVEETGAPLAAGVTLAGAGVVEGAALQLEQAAPEAPPEEPASPLPAPPPPVAPAAPKAGLLAWVSAVSGVVLLVASLAVGGMMVSGQGAKRTASMATTEARDWQATATIQAQAAEQAATTPASVDERTATPAVTLAPTVTPTPYPTYTLYPTYTPVPTGTPIPPTSTPLPTDTPIPPTPTPLPPTDTPMPTPTPVPVAGGTRMREKDGMAMVYVPAGEFTMGSDDGDVDVRPAHTVYMDAFWIDKYEVTNAQYGECVEAGACRAPTTCGWGEPTYGDASKANHPVVCVHRDDAQAYCAWAGARLPTEAEWEKAARGTDEPRWPWGNTFDVSKVNFCDRNCEFEWKDAGVDDGYARTAPVGSFPAGASPYGALDMAGNVWEWVADWYDAHYYAHSPSHNPQGPDSGTHRVLHGGAWSNDKWLVQSAVRDHYVPTETFSDTGFRCAQE
jgi:formylglycine-generating enzyme required for sulfatase activity